MFRTKKLCLTIILLSSFLPTQEAQAQAKIIADIAIGVLSSLVYDTGKEAYKTYDQCKIEKGEDKCSKNNIEDAKKYESILEELRKNNEYSQKDKETIAKLNEEIKQLRERIEIQKKSTRKNRRNAKQRCQQIKA